MTKLPVHLKSRHLQRRVCLILEGLEERAYFERLVQLNVFYPGYQLRLVNAKGSSNIPARYQDALASDSYSIVLVVCDMDKNPDAYRLVEIGIGNVIGPEKAKKVITFSRPCTLQIILSHFDDVNLTSQVKREARADVERLTGVSGYDAHEEQLSEICGQIFQRTWQPMRQRLRFLSKDPEHIPSSNMDELFDCLCSPCVAWIDCLNESILHPV